MAIKHIHGFKGFKKGKGGKVYCKPGDAKAFYYEKGKTYKSDRLLMCSHGFHFCQEFYKVNNHYRFTYEGHLFAKVTAVGKCIHDSSGGSSYKSVTNALRIDSDFYNIAEFLQFIKQPTISIQKTHSDFIEKMVYGYMDNIQPGCIAFRNTYSILSSTVAMWNKTGQRLRTGAKKEKHKLIMRKYQLSRATDPFFVVEIHNIK